MRVLRRRLQTNTSSRRPRSTTRPLSCVERTLQDRFFLGLYLLAGLAGAVLAYLSFANGDPDSVLRGTDRFGNICGRDNTDRAVEIFNPNTGKDTREQPYLYFFAPGQVDSVSICVRFCPTSAGDVAAAGACLNAQISGIYVYNPAESHLNMNTSGCPISVTDTMSNLNRCVQRSGSPYATTKNPDGVFVALLGDIINFWKPLLVLFCLVTAACWAVMWFVRKAPHHFFSAAMLFGVSMLALIALLGWTGLSLHTEDGSVYPHDTNKIISLCLSGFLTLAAMICFGLGVLVRSQAVAMLPLFDVVAQALYRMPSLMLVPLLTSLGLLGLAMYVSAWCIFYYGTYETKSNNQDPQHVVYFDNNPVTSTLMPWIPLVLLIWTYPIIHHLQSIAVAGAAAEFFYSRDRTGAYFKAVPLRTLLMGLRKHLGSAAVGALVTILLKPLQLTWGVGYRLFYNTPRPCCSCWEAYLSLLRPAEREVFVEMAYFGGSYRAAWQMAWLTVTTNPFLYIRSTRVVELSTFTLKMAITALLTFIAALWITHWQNNLDVLQGGYLVLLVAVALYIIVDCYTSMLTVLLSAIAYLSCDDLERHVKEPRSRFIFMPEPVLNYALDGLPLPARRRRTNVTAVHQPVDLEAMSHEIDLEALGSDGQTIVPPLGRSDSLSSIASVPDNHPSAENGVNVFEMDLGDFLFLAQTSPASQAPPPQALTETQVVEASQAPSVLAMACVDQNPAGHWPNRLVLAPMGLDQTNPFFCPPLSVQDSASDSASPPPYEETFLLEPLLRESTAEAHVLTLVNAYAGESSTDDHERDPNFIVRRITELDQRVTTQMQTGSSASLPAGSEDYVVDNLRDASLPVIQQEYTEAEQKAVQVGVLDLPDSSSAEYPAAVTKLVSSGSGPEVNSLFKAVDNTSQYRQAVVETAPDTDVDLTNTVQSSAIACEPWPLVSEEEKEEANYNGGATPAKELEIEVLPASSCCDGESTSVVTAIEVDSSLSKELSPAIVIEPAEEGASDDGVTSTAAHSDLNATTVPGDKTGHGTDIGSTVQSSAIACKPWPLVSEEEKEDANCNGGATPAKEPEIEVLPASSCCDGESTSVVTAIEVDSSLPREFPPAIVIEPAEEGASADHPSKFHREQTIASVNSDRDIEASHQSILNVPFM